MDDACNFLQNIALKRSGTWLFKFDNEKWIIRYYQAVEFLLYGKMLED
jgi:hypothetical protein